MNREQMEQEVQTPGPLPSYKAILLSLSSSWQMTSLGSDRWDSC
jgi:hypothetical protein